MILQALCEYYERTRSEAGIPEPGFSRQKIQFALIIDSIGNLLQVRDLRFIQNNRSGPKELIVPEPVKRSSGIAANFAWDNTMYALGETAADKTERAASAFTAFKKLNHEVGDGIDDEGMKALLRFLDTWQPSKAANLDNWEEMAGLNVVFRLDKDLGFIHERPKVRDSWLHYRTLKNSKSTSTCLVTGIKTPISRIHPWIKGVKNAQTSGAAIVSFGLEAFCSYRKQQNYNAPVGEASAFAYTTALNHLLRFGSQQRIQIGDATTVFWTSRALPLEGFMGMILSPKYDAAELQDRRSFLTSVKEGRMPPGIDPDVRFYILGLSPNASRISIRFWHASTIGDIFDKVGQHFRDLAIVKSFDSDPDFPAIGQLLRETAVLRKSENIPPVLGGALMRSILTGLPYPLGFYSALLGRIRADKEINYFRAAIIKAFLVRKYRSMSVSKEVTMTSEHRRNKHSLSARPSLRGTRESAARRDPRHKTQRSKIASTASPRQARVQSSRKLLRHGPAPHTESRVWSQIGQTHRRDTAGCPGLPRPPQPRRPGIVCIGILSPAPSILRQTRRTIKEKSNMINTIQNRYDFVYLFDVENGNPNGDPDARNMPRIDPETSHGLTTDVCLKRKVRNYVEIVKNDAAPYRIYIKEKAILNRTHDEALDAIGAEGKAGEKGKRGKGEEVEKAKKWLCN